MIYFFSPLYSPNSNGVRIEYELVRMLNALSIPSYNVCECSPDSSLVIPDAYVSNIFYQSDEKIIIEEDDIVFYSDIETGNPLKAKNIVRYLLNRPYALGAGGINYSGRDYLLSYSLFIFPHLPQLYLMTDESTLFQNLRAQRIEDKKKVTVYFGKTQIRQLKKKKNELKNYLIYFEEINYITRGYPKTREETLHSLVDSSLLISFDPLTNLNYEATLLGIPVLLMDDMYDIQNTVFNIPLHGFYFSFQDLLLKDDLEVSKAFPTYIEYLSKQPELVRKEVEKIENHFHLLQTDDSYRIANVKRNSLQQEIDRKTFLERMGGISLVNIDFMEDLPLSVLFSLKPQMMWHAVCKKSKKALVSFAKKILRFIGLFDIVKAVYMRFKVSNGRGQE